MLDRGGLRACSPVGNRLESCVVEAAKHVKTGRPIVIDTLLNSQPIMPDESNDETFAGH